MAELHIQNLSVDMDGRTLADDVSLSVTSGDIVALIGPNGAGKSMTLRGALGLVPARGSVRVDGTDLSKMSPSARARLIAYLPQSADLAWPARVRDIVALGRFAHGAAPSRLRGEDREAVEEALHLCDLTGLADRRADTLSGGEMARMHCARAFAARTPLLLADEPVAALDPAQAFRIMDLLRARASDGLGVLVVLHDIALAARYADRIIALKAGRILASGPTETVMTTGMLSELYGVEADVRGREVILRGPIAPA